ncbi:MAG: 4-hydroxy-tetrahydrodipicolinate reductase [Pseudomonadota bacterium]
MADDGDLAVGIMGAAGRMGRALIRAIAETDGLKLAAATEPAGSIALGNDAGTLAGVGHAGVAIIEDSEAAIGASDVIIDFTSPGATATFAEIAAKAGTSHVIGTTGFDPEHEERIAAAARSIPIVKAGNMSLGVNLLTALTRKVAMALGDDFDIEIVEMHHNQKVDAPSGTALMLGEAAAEGRDVALADRAVRVRDGQTGARTRGDIGFATLRGGTVVGEHDVIFAGADERVVLRHIATDRMIFARGAARAAHWTRGRPAGLYTMLDVLGLADL